MKLIKQSYEIIPQISTLDGLYKHIEKCARTCYKSEDKITEDSAKKFVYRLIKSSHGAMLEHATVYLTIPIIEVLDYASKVFDLEDNPYTKASVDKNKSNICITTNLRVIIENNWEELLKYLSEPTEYHYKRVTVKFVTDQGILREFTRHRKFSFAVESTRYCNYSKEDKFDNGVVYILPPWVDEVQLGNHTSSNIIKQYYNAPERFWKSDPQYNEVLFMVHCANAELIYNKLIEQKCTPQEARNILPLATKCDMVMTGFIDDWEHFFALRADGITGAPHPQAKELAEPLKQEFIKLGLINE